MDVGIFVGQRAIGVIRGKIAIPDLLEEQDGGRTAHLLAPDVLCMLDRVRGCVTQDERRGWKNLEVVIGPAVGGESAFAAANSRPTSESPAWKITGWPCGERGTLKRPEMSNCAPWCSNSPCDE